MTVQKDYHKSGTCSNCGHQKKIMAKGRCGACYSHLYRKGVDRSLLREEIQELRLQALREESEMSA